MDGSTLITHKECESDLIRALLFESSLVNGYSEQIHVDLFKEDVNRRIAKCVLSSKHEAESPADLYDLALRKQIKVKQAVQSWLQLARQTGIQSVMCS